MSSNLKRTRAIVDIMPLFEASSDSYELTLTQLHPGSTVEGALAATGWPLRVAADLRRTPAPTEHELAVLRQLESTKGRTS